MAYKTNNFASINTCSVFCSIIQKLVTTVTLIIFICLLLGLRNKIDKKLNSMDTRYKNESDAQAMNIKTCRLHYVPFNQGVNATFCAESPAPVIFHKKGPLECSVPVLVLQAVVLSISYNLSVFQELFEVLNIDILRNNDLDIVIQLPCGIHLAPDSKSFTAKLDFIGKLHRLSRVGGT